MKNKNLMLLGILMTMTLPLTVKAGTEMHGGDSVVCFQNAADKQKVETILRQNKLATQMGYVRLDPFTDINMDTVTVETLDIWETRQATTPPREFVELTNVEDGVKDRLNVLNTKLSTLAKIMTSSYNGFYAPSKWLASSTGIVEIDDSHELINYTKSCIPVQIAVQTNTRIYYDARLYSKLDDTNKVALILHEMMYAWGKNLVDNSLNIRKYVGLLMLKEFHTYSAEELNSEISIDFNFREHKISLLEWRECQSLVTALGMNLQANYLLYGLNSLGCLDPESKADIKEINYKANELEALSNKVGYKVKRLLYASSSDSYYLKRNELNEAASVKLVDDQIYKVKTQTPIEVKAYNIELSIEDGKVIDAYPETTTELTILGQLVNTQTRDHVLEYKELSSGKKYLSRFYLSEDKKLKSVSGFKKMKNCGLGYVDLNIDGLVTNCSK